MPSACAINGGKARPAGVIKSVGFRLVPNEKRQKRQPHSKTLARGNEAPRRAKLLDCACLFCAFDSICIDSALTTYIANSRPDHHNCFVLPEPTIAKPMAPAPAGWLSLFQPAPAATVLTTDPVTIQRQYRLWQRRVLISSIIGYAVFYFVRKNLSIAMPVMEKELGISKAGLGLFLTLHGVLYGVSKFANGFLGDRANARAFMTAGLVCSALLNL